jgi:hypothetical protein
MSSVFCCCCEKCEGTSACREGMRLDMIAQSFKWLGMPIDLDEVECILANLIFKQYIRGYLSHEKRILVLSKKEPFPTSKVIK